MWGVKLLLWLLLFNFILCLLFLQIFAAMMLCHCLKLCTCVCMFSYISFIVHI